MSSQLDALRAVAANAQLRRLQLSWLATNLAEWGTALALSVYALGRGGPAAVGVMALVRALPGAPMAPLLAAVVDRTSRRTVLLVATLVRAVLLLAIALAAQVEVPLGVVYVLVALLAAGGPAVRPALLALVPRLARTPGELAAANVAASMVRNGGFLAGSLLTGLLLAVAPDSLVLAILAGAFAAGALALLGLERDEPPEPDPDARPVAEVVAGARLVLGDPGLRVLVLLAAALFAVDGALDVLIVIAAVDVLGAGEAGAGVLTSLWGLGCTLGGGAVVALLSRGRLTAGITLGAAVVGLSLVLVGLLPAFGVAAAGLLVFGVGYTLIEVAGSTLLQRLVPDHLLGRVVGVTEAAMAAALGLGSLVGGLIAEAAGAPAGFVAAGLLVPLLVLLRRGRLRRLEAGTPVAEREYRLLREHAIFAPLPVAETERLAAALEEVAVAPGEVLMTEGERGDRFYLVAEGELEVVVGGEHRGVCGPGEGVGEIALLRDVPRVATVRARSQALVLALERDAFLTAVASQAPAGRAAHRIADARRPPA